LAAAGADLLAAAAPDACALVVPADDLSRQALAAQAEDLALEDALAALDAALLHGRLPQGAFDGYLKTTRALARRQFFARARALKAAAELQQRQRQAQQPVEQQQPPLRPLQPAYLASAAYGGALGGVGPPLAGSGGSGGGGGGSAYPRLPS
jgi:hypothetical protein